MTQREIIAFVASKHKLPYESLLCEGVHERGRKSSSPAIARAKAETAWELRARLSLSYPAVARALRLRSHTSAIYLCRTHERRQRKSAAQRHNAAVFWASAPAGTGQMYARRAQAAREYRVTCECLVCPKCRNRAYKIKWRAKKQLAYLTGDPLRLETS